MTMNNPNHGSTAKHQALLKNFDLAVGQSFDDVIIIPYTVGMFRDFDSAERIIRAGYPGIPDRLVLGSGWYLFFDGKTGHATFTKEQRAFRDRLMTINKGEEVVHKLKSVDYGLEIIRRYKEKHDWK